MGWINAAFIPGYEAETELSRPAHNYFIGSDFRQAEMDASAAIRERFDIWRFRLEHAEEQKCIICGEQADTFWPGECRERGARPYCHRCLEQAKHDLRTILLEELKKKENMKNNTDTENCCKCGAPATTLWPYLDPDIPGQPYCDRCMKQIRRDMMLALLDMKPINKGKK